MNCGLLTAYLLLLVGSASSALVSPSLHARRSATATVRRAADVAMFVNVKTKKPGDGQIRYHSPFGTNKRFLEEVRPAACRRALGTARGLWRWRGPRGRTCVATSRDGVTFAKPKLHANGSNVVMDSAANEAMEVVYDHLAKPPHFQCLRNEFLPYRDPPFFEPWTPYTSSDGITWRSHAAPAVGMMADRSTFFLNPLRRTPVWAFSLRENLCRAGHGHMRIRRYHEQPYGTSFAGGASTPARRSAVAKSAAILP